MEVTPETLQTFQAWLRENGRADGTLDLYTSRLRCCARAETFTAPLVDSTLAPKTRRVTLSALRSWADFTEDTALLARLKRIRLPPAVRVKPKVELSLEVWRVVVKHLQQADIAEPMRAVLLIMAKRGLRSGDVLRIRRKEVLEALRTNVLAYEGKGGKRIEYDATPILPELEALAKETGWGVVRELVGGKAKKTSSNRVRNELHRQARAIKVDDLYPHRLRRTYATHFLKRLHNNPQALLMLTKHMSWSNINTAAGYVDAVSAEEMNAVGGSMIADLLKDDAP